MKTYLQLLFEVRTIRSKEDAEKMRQEKENPDDYTVRNKGGGHHHPILKDRLKGQRQRRGSVMRSITMQDLVDYGNRNLIPDTKKIARKALNIEHNEEISMYVEGESLVIKKVHRSCSLCDSKEIKLQIGTKFICTNCVNNIKGL